MSQAAIRILKSFWRRKKASLERLVDLPTPLTPTMEMTYGRREASGFRAEGEVVLVMARRRSREVVGVRILRSEDSIEVRIVASTPGMGIRLEETSRGEWVRTLETASLDTDELTLNTLAEADGGFAGDVFLEKVLLYSSHRLFKVGFSKDFTANNVTEEAADGTET